MSSVVRPPTCAKAELQDLCDTPRCPEEVCGSCCYCGRPICNVHGWHDITYHRYYCKQHGPHNTIDFTIKIVKAALIIARERRVDVTEIPDEELTKSIMEILGLKYPPRSRS